MDLQLLTENAKTFLIDIIKHTTKVSTLQKDP